MAFVHISEVLPAVFAAAGIPPVVAPRWNRTYGALGPRAQAGMAIRTWRGRLSDASEVDVLTVVDGRSLEEERREAIGVLGTLSELVREGAL